MATSILSDSPVEAMVAEKPPSQLEDAKPVLNEQTSTLDNKAYPILD